MQVYTGMDYTTQRIDRQTIMEMDKLREHLAKRGLRLKRTELLREMVHLFRKDEPAYVRKLIREKKTQGNEKTRWAKLLEVKPVSLPYETNATEELDALL